MNGIDGPYRVHVLQRAALNPKLLVLSKDPLVRLELLLALVWLSLCKSHRYVGQTSQAIYALHLCVISTCLCQRHEGFVS